MEKAQVRHTTYIHRQRVATQAPHADAVLDLGGAREASSIRPAPPRFLHSLTHSHLCFSCLSSVSVFVQKLGALTQRLSPATSRPMSPNGLGRNDFYSSTSNGANLNLNNNNNSHFERRSSGGMGSPLPYNARHAAARNGPLNRRGSAQSDNGMGAESLDPNNRGSNAEDEEFDRDVEALLNGQAPRRPTIDAGRPPQRPSLPSIQPPQQPPPQSPQQPLSQVNPLQSEEPPQGPVVSWPDSVGQRPGTATQAPPQTAKPQPPPVSGQTLKGPPLSSDMFMGR